MNTIRKWLLERYIAFCDTVGDAMLELDGPRDRWLLIQWNRFVYWIYAYVAYPFIHRYYTEDEIWESILEDLR